MFGLPFPKMIWNRSGCKAFGMQMPDMPTTQPCIIDSNGVPKQNRSLGQRTRNWKGTVFLRDGVSLVTFKVSGEGYR